MSYKEEIDVVLFIVINCVRVIKLREIILGNDDDFYVKRIVFGWGVVGMVVLDICEGEESVSVNCVVAYEVLFSLKKMCYFVFKTYVKEVFNLV